MSNRQEYWDLYRQDGRLERTVLRGSVVIQELGDLYHETVEIIPTDKAGHLLVTRRALEKRHSGGKFEFPAGSVISGETPIVAARRELFEETGLKVKALTKIDAVMAPGIKRYIYLAHIPDLTTAQVVLQEEETVEYRIITYHQWIGMMTERSFDERRVRLYNEKVLSTLEKLVGLPAESEEAPAAPELKQISYMPGTRAGTSGDAITQEELIPGLGPMDLYRSTEE